MSHVDRSRSYSSISSDTRLSSNSDSMLVSCFWSSAGAVHGAITAVPRGGHGGAQGGGDGGKERIWGDTGFRSVYYSSPLWPMASIKDMGGYGLQFILTVFGFGHLIRFFDAIFVVDLLVDSLRE